MIRCFIAAEEGLLYGAWERDRLTGSGMEPAPALNYLAADREGKRIYATARYEICAFELREDRPRFLYKTPCGGNVACHLCLSPERKHLFCANYISGNVAVFRIGDAGFEFTQSVTGQGRCGKNRVRQEGPHAHYCAFIGGNLWTVDLGQDAIFIFPWDGEKLGKELHRIVFPSGAGPRHLVHDPARNRVYCASELSCELFVIDVPGLRIVEKRPAGGPGDALSAVRLSPDGRTLGIGVRGSDRLVFFDAETLELKSKLSCGGKCVRDFDYACDETVCVCCQGSSSVVFLDLSEARITAQFAVQKPMCVLWDREA
ncbi:MAG: beta-propeller fold lactonase family protein [Lentisphaeria bacterium]|nr:beta-propeller fold lactonase family protein [Lentisphaeria bacterium]